MADRTVAPPSIALPKGGGAIRGIGETFQVNLFNGTSSFSIPIVTSPGRAGFGPRLSLTYSPAFGNGPFGLGWQLSIPRVSRKTEKGLPRYRDDQPDVFVMSGAEDLIPLLGDDGLPMELSSNDYVIRQYLPRSEGAFTRIEQWRGDDGVHWRTVTRDNLTSVYGRTAAARIVDPSPSLSAAERGMRVFEWLLEETFDALGNHIVYEYASENGLAADDVRIYDDNRAYTQLYPRRILYGNSHAAVGPARGAERYLFEVLFDYGDLRQSPSTERQRLFDVGRALIDDPYLPSDGTPETTLVWPARVDRFSTYRSGFEIRTQRRCQRVLMFHHMVEAGNATLVRSTDLRYGEDPDTHTSLLNAVTTVGYKRGNPNEAYGAESMPPLELTYAAFRPDEQRYESLKADGDDLPPRGLAATGFALVDLFGDGLPDIVESGPGGLRCWRNAGDGRLGRPRFLREVPAGLSLSEPGVALADVNADGRAELVVHTGPIAGFFESTTPDVEWDRFRPYPLRPPFSLADPSVRLLDLTGDGRADALMTGDHHFLWYESRGAEGYVEGGVVERVHDPLLFPDVYFDDASERVRLADMTGDGLSDIVLVHNGRVDYWPNLGYGRFGGRVTMGTLPDSPLFEAAFKPNRLFLVDLNGTGTADLVYVDVDRVHFWFNRSGNSWSERRSIFGTPPALDLTSVAFADVFGTGTATLVWSYDSGTYPGGNYKALDFCGGVKPYVLSRIVNNLGLSTRLRYVASTVFAARDAHEGAPWVTPLPFPVQVLERVETADDVTGDTLVTTYSYHHGFYDGHEREFRGFGRVDQMDTETAENPALPAFPASPVLTKRWFHTGAYFDAGLGLRQRFQKEYYSADHDAFRVEDDHVEDRETPRQAYRALRGLELRSETYGLDDSAQAGHPFVTTSTAYTVTRLQAATAEAAAVYLALPRETLSFNYERDPLDPRVTHDLTLEWDTSGNATRRLTVAYPRRGTAACPEQTALHASFRHSRYINTPDSVPAGTYVPQHFVGVCCEERLFEISGVEALASPARLLGQQDFEPVTSSASDADFAAAHSRPGGFGKRILAWSRSYFRSDTDPDVIDAPGVVTHRLPLGVIGARGLPYETYQLALTEPMLETLFEARYTPRLRDELNTEARLGYHREADVAGWWIPSGRHSLHPDRFYLTLQTQDAFGARTTIDYDTYDLLPRLTEDAFGNVTSAEHDYRVLQPALVTDMNGCRAAASFSPMGLVVATAVMGLAADNVGDQLPAVFELPVDAPAPGVSARGYFRDPLRQAPDVLQTATKVIVYDTWRFHAGLGPAVVATLARATHVSDEGGAPIDIQQQLQYFDGLGRQIQVKASAEAGPLDDEPGSLVAQLRWAVSGWTVYNNKGKPVRRYEPFFSDTHEFQPGRDAQRGVSVTLFYDSLLRVIATLYPDHSYDKVIFSAWSSTTWDRNDTVAVEDAGRDDDIGAFVRRLPDGDYRPGWARMRIDGGDAAGRGSAAKAAAHASTPATTHIDPLGSVVLTVTDNGADAHAPGSFETRVRRDIQGRALSVIDPRGVVTGVNGILRDTGELVPGVDMAGRTLRTASPDAGVHMRLQDAGGGVAHEWDANGNHKSVVLDRLRRPVEVWVEPSAAPPFLAVRTVYGELLDAGNRAGFAGRVCRVYDGAGVLYHDAFDFKGNPTKTRRGLSASAEEQPRWNVLAGDGLTMNEIEHLSAPALEPVSEWFTTTVRYDAFNRVVESVAPDGSRSDVSYNEAGLTAGIAMTVAGDPAGRRTVVEETEYNAKGQLRRQKFGNGVTTVRTYDASTGRLHTMTSTRGDGLLIHAYSYTFDPVGNRTRIHDEACEPVYRDNAEIEAAGDYTYDALYRLIKAVGREHMGIGACAYQDRDQKFTSLVSPAQPITNCQAVRLYTQRFQYDRSGNLERVSHQAPGNTWTRRQTCEADAAVPIGNRLVTSDAGCDGEDRPLASDANGNLSVLPFAHALTWNYANQLVAVTMNASNGGTANQVHFQYDAAGERVRKVEAIGGTLYERIYVGGFETYRVRRGAIVRERHDTLHVVAGDERVALIERRDAATPDAEIRVRYVIRDDTGSCVRELDDTPDAGVVSYEEYYPYGGSAYLAADDASLARRKRYRHGGKECDDETGLYYYGARYYAPWLGRWLSVDPRQRPLADVPVRTNGDGSYVFCLNNPVNIRDARGLAPTDEKKPPAPPPAATSASTPPPTAPAPLQLPEGFSRSDTKGMLVEEDLVFKRLSTMIHGEDGTLLYFETQWNAETGQLRFPMSHSSEMAKSLGPDVLEKLTAEHLQAYGADPTSVKRVTLVDVVNPPTVQEAMLKEGKAYSETAMNRRTISGLRKSGFEAKLVAEPEITQIAAMPGLKTVSYDVTFKPRPGLLGPKGFALPEVLGALSLVLLVPIALEIAYNASKTGQKSGGAMATAQVGKDVAKHSTNFLWFAAGGAAAFGLVAIGSPVVLALLAGIAIAGYGPMVSNGMIDAVTSEELR